MPNTKSAAKRLRSSEEKRMRNRVDTSRIKTAEKRFLKSLEAGDLETAKANLATCFSTLDKAAKGSAITRNKADRKKGRLSAKLSAANT